MMVCFPVDKGLHAQILPEVSNVTSCTSSAKSDRRVRLGTRQLAESSLQTSAQDPLRALTTTRDPTW